MPDISKITLPSGTTYNIKDAGARELIEQLSGSTAYLGITTTPLYDECTTSTISVNGEDISVSNGNIAIYGKREFIFDGTKWSEFGDLELLNVTTTTANVFGIGTSFAGNESNVTFTGGANDVVLGEGTTFALASGAVTHGSPSVDAVLGNDTIFSASSQTVTLGDTKKYLTATASGAGASWNNKNQKTVVTGYASPITDTFVKEVDVVTGNKLVTTSIVPTDGTETVSKVTQTVSKLTTTSVPNVTSNANKTIEFAMGGTDGETLIISGSGFGTGNSANTYTASLTGLGSSITVATGGVAANGSGTDIVTGISISDKTVAKVGSAVTVATGATAANGTGDAIVSGVTVSSSGPAITGLGTASTAEVIGASSTFTNDQPTITLTANATNVSGSVQYIESASPTISVPTITAGTNDLVDAVTAMPTSTVGTTITVGTNDKVTAITNVGTAKAAGQVITVTPSTVAAVTSVTLTDTSGDEPTTP